MPTATAGELELHNRLLSGDPVASAMVFEQYMEKMVQILSSGFPDVAKRDQTLIWDAVTDALISYTTTPKQFAPERSRLSSYLRMSARGDLLNTLDRLKREQAKFSNIVELQDVARNKSIEAHQEPYELGEEEIWSQICKIITDPTDREIVRLMVDGVRSYHSYAECMGIVELPVFQMKRKVKQAKDRLKAKLRRTDWSNILE